MLRAKSFILSASFSEAIFPPSHVLPESILGMGGSYFVFDEEGFLDEATLQLVRQLTAENAHHIGEHMSLESRLVSALEWDTDED